MQSPMASAYPQPIQIDKMSPERARLVKDIVRKHGREFLEADDLRLQ